MNKLYDLLREQSIIEDNIKIENIQKLDLTGTLISSLEGIEDFKRLSSLNITHTSVNDISMLKNLDLDYFKAEECFKLNNFDSLKSMSIKTLDLSSSGIIDYSFLSELIKLETLILNGNSIEEFSAIPSINSLKKLFLEDNFLDNITTNSDFPNLEEIYLTNNRLISIKGISNFEKLNKIRISNNAISDISELSRFKSLKKLYLSHNNISDISSLENIKISEKLTIADNKIKDSSPLNKIIQSGIDVYGIEELNFEALTLTEEQKAIIDYPLGGKKLLKVNAYAGTGKTTTAIEFIKNNLPQNNKKVLYLSFNVSVQNDIVNKVSKAGIKSFVDVLTAHGFARKILSCNCNRSNSFNLKNEIEDVKSILVRNDLFKKDYAIDASVFIVNFMQFYLNYNYGYSGAEIKKAFDYFITNKLSSNNHLYKTNDSYKKLLLGSIYVLEDLLDKYYNKRYEFNFYVKIAGIRLKRNSNLQKVYNNKYEYIIFDEAQDASMVMLDIINSLNLLKVFIGDTHQQIYSFRYAVNILEKIKQEPLYLSESFRFKNSIAGFAKRVLALKGVKTTLKGKRASGQIQFYDNVLIGEYKKVAIISRMNATLFYYAKDALNYNKKLYFEGGINSYYFASSGAKAIYFLCRDAKKIYHPYFSKFRTFEELKKYASDTDNQEILTTIGLISANCDNFLKIVKSIRDSIVKKEEADVIFSTTHKSKGIEYDTVIVTSDFKVSVDDLKLNNKDEVNLLYVALTRAKLNLFLPKEYESIKDFDIDKTVNVVNSFKKCKFDEITVNININDLNGFKNKLEKNF